MIIYRLLPNLFCDSFTLLHFLQESWFKFKGEEKRKKKKQSNGKFRGNNMMCFEKGTLGWVLIPLLNKLKGESITLVVKERKRRPKKKEKELLDPSINPALA